MIRELLETARDAFAVCLFSLTLVLVIVAVGGW
jgi:hypothetical protein